MLTDPNHAATQSLQGGFSASRATLPAQNHRKPLTASLRALVERRIEKLIELLDAADGNPDDEEWDEGEDNGDFEPSYGGSAYVGYGQYEVDLELDTSDTEYELGATSDINQETAWAPIARDQWYEPDGEPFLGSLDSIIGQTSWGVGSTAGPDGRENCCEDEGAQCDDEGEPDLDDDGEHSAWELNRRAWLRGRLYGDIPPTIHRCVPLGVNADGLPILKEIRA